jgi:zeta-carotene desaturase
LLPKEMSEQGGYLEGAGQLKTSPITSVHFWFEEEVIKEPFLTLMDHTSQWIFNKTMLNDVLNGQNGTGNGSVRLNEKSGSGNASKGQYLQVVISASYDLVPLSRQEIIDLCRRELAQVVPATRDAKLRKAAVIKEVHATFSPVPGVDLRRPSQDIGLQNLFLAGDWTLTGWPATMEGAVRSGYLAGECVLASFGKPQKFLQPDLPLEGLSRIWANGREPSK